MSQITSVLDDFLGIFYPNMCQGCGEPLLKHENFICSKCMFSIPRTNYHNSRKNMISELFLGKVKIEYATSFCFFHKDGILQNLIHSLKYKGGKEVGETLGKYFGSEINTSDFSNIDLIIPVPLHPKRQKFRGYNQSEWIAKGLGEIMNKPVDVKSVIRSRNTKTQTEKNKDERWENVKNIFEVVSPKDIENKHVLVIDDVITTGATIESCASTILDVKNTKISIASIGVASI